MTIRSRRTLLAACIPILLGHLDTAAAPAGPMPAPPALPNDAARKPLGPGDGAASPPPIQLRTICGPEEYYTLVDAAPATSARFTLGTDGGLQVNASSDVPLSLSFVGFDGDAIARVEEVTAAGPRVWCAAVKTGVRYSFPEKPVAKAKAKAPTDPSPVEGTLLRVQLYTAPTVGQPSNPALAARRASVLQTAQLTERRAVHGFADIDKFVRQWTGAQPNIRNISVLTGLVNQSDSALTHLNGEIGRWACSSGGRDDQGPLAPAVCDELGKVSATLQDIKATLTQMIALAGQEPVGEVYKRYYEKLPTLVASLAWEPSANAAETQQQQCATLAKLRWLTEDSMYRLTARAIIPVVPDSHLATVRYEGTSAQPAADVTQSWGMVVTGVPVGTKMSFSSQQGTLISVDPSTALSTLFKYAVAGLPAMFPGARMASNFVAPPLAPDTPAELESLHADDIPSLLCRRPSTTGTISGAIEFLNKNNPTQDIVESLDAQLEELWSTSDVWLTIDPDLPPTAGVEAVSGIYVPFDGKHVVDLIACAAPSCSSADGDKTVRGRVSLTPDRTGSWTMLVEASLGFGLLGTTGTAWKQGPFAIQNSPTFEAVNRGDAPDQLFEMDLHANPRNTISTGLMVGRYFKDRWLFALGPTLTVGGSSGIFSQWNARFAYRWGDRGTYVTFGPSVRFVSQPEDFDLHDRVSVPRPASGGAAEAPKFRTTTGAELQFDIGLAIDIGTLGSAASDALKTFGGGR